MTSPIFIHSLFRAGSTYLFNVFRRSEAGYWCYCEPLHELAVWHSIDPHPLVVGDAKKNMLLNRHPIMELPYTQELYDVWPSWRDVINDFAVYGAYFSPQDADIGLPYWRALINSSNGRPVFQECRTSCRIDAIKKELGGYHIYLWRNPWDQWWSYKINNYFDIVSRILVCAPGAPKPVMLLRDALDLNEVNDYNDISALFAFGQKNPLTSENSYLAFYMLWCLGLQSGIKYAHQLLNIDRLSESQDYQRETSEKLSSAGWGGLDFSDSRVFQGVYSAEEKAHFKKLEERVEQWLLEGGWTQGDVNQIHVLKAEFDPVLWRVPSNMLSPDDLLEQASRARQVAIRMETQLASVEKAAHMEAQLVSVQKSMNESSEVRDINPSRLTTFFRRLML